jgi:hypothetical protein
VLCVLTYKGAGYSPAFVAQFDAVIERLAAGEDAVVVDGPDDICAARLSDPADRDHHCRDPRIAERDEAARAALAFNGGDVTLDEAAVAHLRARFAAGEIRAACAKCAWKEFCDEIAAAGYAGAKLHPSST